VVAVEDTVAAAAADVVAADAVAVEEAGDKRTINLKNNENKTTHYEFIENFSDCFYDAFLLLVRLSLPRGAGAETRRNCGVAAETKGIRHTETGSGCSYSGSDEF
jgi:hypothetical protein